MNDHHAFANAVLLEKLPQLSSAPYQRHSATSKAAAVAIEPVAVVKTWMSSCKTADLSQATLKEYLRYEPDTGLFYWIKRSGRACKIGAQAGLKQPKRYCRIRLFSVMYTTHRLAWLYMYGCWPKEFVDHIDGDKTNNRILNLRSVSNGENMQNLKNCTTRNKSTGLLGASVLSGVRIKNPFRASIQIHGKNRQIGVFPTAEAAHLAYLEEKRRLHVTCTI